MLAALHKLRDQKVTGLIGVTGHESAEVMRRAIEMYQYSPANTTETQRTTGRTRFGLCPTGFRNRYSVRGGRRLEDGGAGGAGGPAGMGIEMDLPVKTGSLRCSRTFK